MRNQKGVTLIALVITIIVLLILAGVSIAMLTGDNGILTKSAKINQIEGQVREEINLAVQATKMYAENKAVTTNTGYLASENAADIKANLEKDLTSTKGYTVAEGSNKVTITYTTEEYTSATNKSTANITVDVNLDGNKFEIGTFTYNK